MSTVGLAIVLFASTNIDDIFVLIGFFASPKFRTRQIAIGQYLGIAALIAASALLSLVSLVLAPAHVGLLGLLPIVIGCQKLFHLWRGGDEAEGEVKSAGLGNVLAVAAVTIANGGDNIGVYTPVFATSDASEILLILLVFAAMVAIWIAFSHWLVNHRALGAPIRRFAHIVTPLVLIAIGLLVLYEAGSFSLLTGPLR